MKDLDWNDLRFALALGRERTLTAAARAFGVSQPTASRRLAAVERAIGTKLFLRGALGYAPTDAGRRLLDMLEGVSSALGRAETLASDERKVEGVVRLAVTDVTAIHLLEAALPALHARHPALVVELLVGTRVLDLSRREADLAVRLVSPEGAELARRSLGEMRYGLYASERYVQKRGKPADAIDLGGHAIIQPIGEIASSPEAQYLAEHVRGTTVALRTTSMLAMAHAAAAGMGLAILPVPIALSVGGLTRVSDVPALRPRKIWLVTHADARRIPRVRAVMDVVEKELRKRMAARG
jgi:DNA-binding transcriptional LysR family regulator